MPRSAHSERYRRFREGLTRERRKAGKTQAEVARRLGRPQSYISKYEGGERRLDVVEFLDIADAVGFDPVAFLKRLRKGK
jgi:transcriptional regulator with XRE-family HTH domain